MIATCLSTEIDTRQYYDQVSFLLQLKNQLKGSAVICDLILIDEIKGRQYQQISKHLMIFRPQEC